jgi:hypothetical protein
MSEESGIISSLFGRVAPLPREIYRRCIEENITSIRLRFSGGSDEGYRDVELNGPDGRYFEWKRYKDEKVVELMQLIDSWCDENYRFGGAGDGNLYGENITYDIVNGTVTSQEWWTQQMDGEVRHDSMETC